MNIFLFEFKNYKKSIIIWSLAISFWIVFYMAFFPMIEANAEGYDMIMQDFPPEFLAMFGMNSELPMGSILGYFGLTYSMAQIPIAIQAANYGFHTLSVEERELTADFLLSKPVKRSKIIISKFLAAVVSLTIVNIFIWISSIGSIYLFKMDQTVELKNVIILLSTVLLFQLYFLSVGMVISVSVRKISSVLSYSMALGFGLYIMNSFMALFSSDIFGVLSPYSHYNCTYILVEGHYHLIFTIISVSIIIVSLSMSYFLYLRRNIPSL
ncbi:MAG: ABC transporter permease subunit [Candidatus Izimaplasma sp.]|nr:ABC transporter permease subunit [Candidatus Izimaplasma bacterium]